MIKVVVVCTRKEGMSLEAFRDYWFNNHAALARTTAAATRMKRYVQSVRVPSTMMDAVAADRGWEGQYDGLTEVWFGSEEDMIAGFTTPEGLAANKLLQEDEERFTETRRIITFLSEEHVAYDAEQ